VPALSCYATEVLTPLKTRFDAGRLNGKPSPDADMNDIAIQSVDTAREIAPAAET
jgi:hypothetical protein